MIKGFNFHLILKKIKKNRNLKIQKCMCVCGGGGLGGGKYGPNHTRPFGTQCSFLFLECVYKQVFMNCLNARLYSFLKFASKMLILGKYKTV